MFSLPRDILEVIASFYVMGPLPLMLNVPVDLCKWGIRFPTWPKFDASVMMGTEMAEGRVTGYFGPIIHLETIFAAIYQPEEREWCVHFPTGWKLIAREADKGMNNAYMLVKQGAWSRAVQHLGQAQAMYEQCDDAFWAEIRTKWRIFDVAMKIGKDVW